DAVEFVLCVKNVCVVLKASTLRPKHAYFGAGGSRRSWNLEARRSAASTRLLSLAFSFMANFTLSVALQRASLLRASNTVILISVGEMFLRVEVGFCSWPLSGETLDELENCTPLSPLDSISMMRSAFSAVSTIVKRPQPSIVD